MNNYFIVCVRGFGRHDHLLVIGAVREDGIYAIFTDDQGRKIHRCLTANYTEVTKRQAQNIAKKLKCVLVG